MALIAYQGTPISTRDEMLSLTDMWRAAGAVEAQRPANWARKEGAPFIEAVSVSLNVPEGHIYRAVRGKNGGGTWAHWQIAFAYAKYLSPEFHIWCNEVVRAHMVGRAAPSRQSLDENAREAIGGIVKAVVGKMMKEGLAELVPSMVTAALSADPRVAVGEFVSVRQLLDEAKVPARGRNRLNRRVGAALRARTMEAQMNARRCPITGTWLFGAGAARAWMRDHGGALVASHAAEIHGQTILRLVPATKRKTD